ncbi:hypothetical protein JOM56_002525 [Amanita muscaria]
MMATLARGITSAILYTLSPVLYSATVLTTPAAIPWLLLCSVTSSIIISLLGANLLKDPNLIIFQFVYWSISWGWLAWRISQCDSFLPVFLANQMANPTFITIILILALLFADALFFSIVSSTNGALGRYGNIHTTFWDRLWDCLLSIRDILVRTLGPRREVVVTPAEHEAERSHQASSPPPQYDYVSFPSYRAIIVLSSPLILVQCIAEFPSSLVKSSLSMDETV